MKTRVELLEEIVRKQDERMKFMEELFDLYDESEIIDNSYTTYYSIKNKLKLNNIEITDLKSQLAEAGEEKRNKLIKAYSDLVIEIDKHKGTTIKEIKLRNKIANLKLEIR